ncbi:MAG: G1 family glutamic endopeptidase [Solirubrobacteraceae bacterium]
MTFAAAVLACLATASGADAANGSTTSANWSGYAAHGGGASFRRVSGIWTVPNATCTAGTPAYSAVWVGIGGYSLKSNALEQIGTETDCTRAGRVKQSAWYELVPAPSRQTAMRISAGDVMWATVGVDGHKVTLTLTDLTSRRVFKKTVQVTSVDTGSAEWIVEAPSECSSSGNCLTLPLANFGSVNFTRAQAESARGQFGTITSSHWKTTEIRLTAATRAQFGPASPAGGGAQAVPSALASASTAFSVSYSLLGAASAPTQPPFFGRTRLGVGRLAAP